MICLHGFMDTWRSWELVLPMLERRHEVLALTLPGHAGGPPLTEPVSTAAMIDAVERSIDEAGIGRAHLVGNSLGGYIALALAARGRATTVVAFAPAGGWAVDDRIYTDVLDAQRQLHEQAKLAAPYADQVLSSNAGRRRATGLITTNFEHIPAELLAHQMLGVASCRSAIPLLDNAARSGWPLDARAIACPLRFIWGSADRLLPFPSAAARFRAELPQADWIVLDDVGHCPQLDVPVEAAQLTLGFTTSA
jgi:pimeloyl-ACP methyl ester carboxylesterase